MVRNLLINETKSKYIDIHYYSFDQTRLVFFFCFDSPKCRIVLIKKKRKTFLLSYKDIQIDAKQLAF